MGSNITVGDSSYELAQFHFHHPSEEEINGKRHLMTVHLVHKNKEGKLAVVAVLIDEDKANPLISTLWKNLTTEKGKELARDDIKVNASDLLPSSHDYYTYTGSLTTPPCSETSLGMFWRPLFSSLEHRSKGLPACIRQCKAGPSAERSRCSRDQIEEHAIIAMVCARKSVWRLNCLLLQSRRTR